MSADRPTPNPLVVATIGCAMVVGAFLLFRSRPLGAPGPVLTLAGAGAIMALVGAWKARADRSTGGRLLRATAFVFGMLGIAGFGWLIWFLASLVLAVFRNPQVVPH